MDKLLKLTVGQIKQMPDVAASKTSPPLLSVVIVAYNSRHFIDQCLRPLCSDSTARVEVIVVDNCSTDGTADYIKNSYPAVRLFRSETNGGFAAGNNLGFRHCTGAYILLLNPDAFVESTDQLLNMVAWLEERPDVGAMGPKLMNPDGTHQVGDAGWAVSTVTILTHMLFLSRLLPMIPSLYITKFSGRPDEGREVGWVCGACCMVRKEVIIEVGGLDETIFMYGEDVELGSRVRASGRSVMYVPEFAVLHLQGATQKGTHAAFFSTKWIDSSLSMLARDHGAKTLALARVIFFAGFAVRAGLYAAMGMFPSCELYRTRSQHMRKYARYVSKLPVRTSEDCNESCNAVS